MLENVVAMLEAERLACFGGGTIEVEGTFTCSSCGGGASGVYEPVWLASPTTAALVGPGGASGPSLPLHFAPSGTAMPAEGARISVRGHFDDPAATTCRLALPMPGEPDASLSPVDVDSVILLCRQAFVVESYEGTPSPPGPRFDLDAVVSVVEGPLRVRSLPRVADDSDKFDPLLQTGQLLFVIDGPIRASEYDWYLVQTIGELCLSPVGLSITTKLAPEKYGSQMMGVWFLAVTAGDCVTSLASLAGADLNGRPFVVTEVLVAVLAGALIMLFRTQISRRFVGHH